MLGINGARKLKAEHKAQLLALAKYNRKNTAQNKPLEQLEAYWVKVILLTRETFKVKVLPRAKALRYIALGKAKLYENTDEAVYV